MNERTVLRAGAILLGVSLFIPWTEGRDFAPAQKWTARYNGPGNGADRARAMAVDKSGNVYVTGESTGARVDVDFATLKYSPAGKRLWPSWPPIATASPSSTIQTENKSGLKSLMGRRTDGIA